MSSLRQSTNLVRARMVLSPSAFRLLWIVTGDRGADFTPARMARQLGRDLQAVARGCSEILSADVMIAEFLSFESQARVGSLWAATGKAIEGAAVAAEGASSLTPVLQGGRSRAGTGGSGCSLQSPLRGSSFNSVDIPDSVRWRDDAQRAAVEAQRANHAENLARLFGHSGGQQ